MSGRRLALDRVSPIYLAFGVLAFGAGTVAGHGLPTAVAVCGGLVLLTLLLKNAVVGSAVVVLATLCIGAVEPPRVGGITLINVCLVVCLSVLVLHDAVGSSRSTVVRWPIWSLLFGIVILISPTNPSSLSGLSTPLLTATVVYFMVKKNMVSILWILGIAGIFHAAIGFYESISHTSLIYTAWKDQTAADVGGIRRAASTIGDPNYLAVTLLCAAPGVAAIARKWELIPRLAVWTLYSSAFILTFSRGAFLGALIAASLYMCRKYSKIMRPSRLVGIVLGFSALALVLAFSPVGQPLIDRFSGVDASTRSRSVLQAAALELFQDNWLTGLGFGNLQSYLAPLAHALVPLNASGVSAFLPQTDPLNTYLLVGAEGGAVALLLVLTAVFVAVARTIRVAPGLASTVVGLSASAATLDLLQSPVVWCLMVLTVHFWKGRQNSPTVGASESLDDSLVVRGPKVRQGSRHRISEGRE